MDIIVELAVGEDIEWIMTQLKRFSQFYGTKRSLFGADEFVRTGVENIINNHVCFVAHQDGKRSGFIAGYLSTHPYNPEIRLLSEAFWWVDEGYRGGRSGLKLLDKFTEYGRENADWITMSSIENTSPINDNVFLKRGFHLHEKSFLIEVN